MKKKILAFTLALAMLTFSLAGCGEKTDGAGSADGTVEEGKTDQSKMTDVTLNEVAHSIFYAPMYVAIEEGYFADEGINLTLVTGFGVV